MSNRAEDPKALFRQFIQTLSQIPPTTPTSQLDKLTKLQRVLEKEENLVSEADVVKRERLVKEYEDELRKSSKQSQSVLFVDIMSDRISSTLSSKWTSVTRFPCDSGSWDKPVQSCNT
jgi:hypothetical protein